MCHYVDAFMEEEHDEVPEANAYTAHAQVNDPKLALCQTKRMFRTFSEKSMLGFITLYGSVRLTISQYEHICAIMSVEEHNSCLPSHSMLRQHMLPQLVKENFVRSSVLMFPVTKDHDTTGISTEKKDAVVILPSSWAVMDTGSIHVFDDLYCTSRSCKCRPSNSVPCTHIEQSQILQNPRNAYGRSISFWVDDGGAPLQAENGDVVQLDVPSVSSKLSPYINTIANHTRNGPYLISMQYLRSFLVSTDPDDKPTFICCDNSRLRKMDKHLCDYLWEWVVDNPSTITTEEPSRIAHATLYPGDLISVLTNPDCTATNNVVAVYINRHWRTRRFKRPNTVLWLHISEAEGSVYLLHSYADSHVPRLLSGVTRSTQTELKCRSTGVLPCGKKYFIYHVLLYCDDFTARSPLFPKGSVGGCYLVPVGLSLRRRRRTISVRLVSLTPNGVSTNMVLDAIVDDLNDSAVSGVDAVDPTGEKCVVFVNVVGFVGDYPASSATLDTMTHAAAAPCTVCSFRKFDGPSKDRVSAYAYTSDVHSATAAFSRGFLKTSAVRNAHIGDMDCNYMGMNPGNGDSIQSPGLWPLLRLSAAISGSTSRSTLEQEKHPLQGYTFDAYCSSIVAPDHLITGLITNLLDACFDDIRTPEDLRRLDLALRDALNIVGVVGQRCLLNFSTRRLYSMKMSTKYALLTVLPPVLRSIGLDKSLTCFPLIVNLNKLSSLLFWWPRLIIDGHDAVNFVHGADKRAYHSKVYHITLCYLQEVKRVCASYPWLKAHIDKPNVHRLLELSVHTLPIFAHVLLIAELVFEGAHQPFKKALGRSSNGNAHIYASHMILSRDWLSRVTHSYALWQNGDDGTKYRALRTLLMLFCGTWSLYCDWDTGELKELKKRIADRINKCVSGRVFGRLRKWYGLNSDGWDDDGYWVGMMKPSSHDHSTSREFLGLLRDISREGSEGPSLFSRALFYRVEHGVQLFRYKQHIL